MNCASTDMGNVSLVCRPSTPTSASTRCPRSTTRRSSPAHCVTLAADRALTDAATALAWTAADAALNPALRNRLLDGNR